ncbi:MAG: HAMP domain-containing histidine kinase [Gammaproteobacteria bacterium]|nr:HAMP domain-containing histidine kinase [Gammaproteobacteria bacterium]
MDQKDFTNNQESLFYLQEQLDSCKRENRQLKEILQKKEDAIANFNHEMLTPANSIFGLMDLALEKKLPEDVQTYFQDIKAACSQLKGVMRNVRAYTDDLKVITVESLVDVNLYEFFENLLIDIHPNARKKNNLIYLALQPDVPTTVQLYESGFRDVIAHLIDNANKFTEKGEIQIAISTSDNGNNLLINIRDGGTGISEELSEKVFEPFFQEDSSSTRNFGGTGLGLTVAKKIINNIGGQLTLINNKNPTDFQIEIPLKIRPSAIMNKFLFSEETQNASILVCSERKKLSESIELMLQHMGINDTQSVEVGSLEALFDKTSQNSAKKNIHQYLFLDWFLFVEKFELLSLLNEQNHFNFKFIFLQNEDTKLSQNLKETNASIHFLEQPLTRAKLYHVVTGMENVTSTEWQKTIKDLTNSISTFSQSNSKEKSEIPYQLLELLINAAREGNYELINNYLNQLKNNFSHLFHENSLNEIQESNNDFDFEKVDKLARMFFVQNDINNN